MCVEGGTCSIVSLASVISKATSFIPSSAILSDSDLETMETMIKEEEDNPGHFISGDTRHGIWKRRRLLDGCLNR